jgi:hypothetical protein
MRCIGCGSTAVSERTERTAQGYRRYRCHGCGKQFNERSATLLNRTQYPSDVIALVVLWRLRYKLSLRDLPEMFLIRGIVFSHDAVRDWEAKLTPALARVCAADGAAKPRPSNLRLHLLARNLAEPIIARSRTFRGATAVAPKNPTPLEVMDHRLKTPEGKKLYAFREQTPEPVFGIIKSALGFRPS